MPHELLWTLLFYEKEYLASTQWANFIPNYPIAVQEIKSLDMFFFLILTWPTILTLIACTYYETTSREKTSEQENVR